MATTILRLPAVKARTGLSRSTIYLRISEGAFPKPVSLGPRSVGWVETEILEWIAERVEARNRIKGRRRRENSVIPPAQAESERGQGHD